MKTILTSIFAAFIFLSCSKTGTRALKQGDYYNATLQAVEKLRKDTDNNRALDVLQNSYDLASEDLLANISLASKSNEAFKHERIYDSYLKLNTLHQEINTCASCRRTIRTKAYAQQEQDSRELAAKERYAAGELELKKGTMESGRVAFGHFQTLFDFYPTFSDTREKLDEALMLGSFHVVLEPAEVNSRTYKLSAEYFNEQVQNFVRENRRMNEFVRFYSPSEAVSSKLKPNHLVKLEFVDFVVGQTLMNSSQKTVSKDSVKTGTVKVNGVDKDVVGTVNAKYTEYKKSVRSAGVLKMVIEDYETRKVLFNRDFNGEFIWRNEWASFNGDERALSSEQIKLSKQREQLPPGPDVLFVEFCRPIHSQVTNELRRFYKDY